MRIAWRICLGKYVSNYMVAAVASAAETPAAGVGTFRLTAESGLESETDTATAEEGRANPKSSFVPAD